MTTLQDLPKPRYDELNLGRKLLVVACFAVSLNYLVWRTGTLNPDAPVFSALLYAAELFGFLMVSIHYLTVWRLSLREPPEPMPGRSVDVFIPTINETVATVRRTALAAQALDYPHTLWILDDGRRAEIKQLADDLGCGYITRPDNKHAKAGNLNHALTKTSGEFIAFFDADHAPKKNFLSRTLGYFRDPLVAFVQTPQEFYNLDSYQHRLDRKTGRMWTDQSLFFRVIQRGKDAWNAAFFCGSCAVMRRSALEKIGGFAVGTVAEDLHTSIVIHKAGFRSVFHDELLAFGIAAAQLEAFFKQRMRWGQGALQSWRREYVLLGRGLTLMQRLLYLSSSITYFTGWQKLIFYVTPPLALLTNTLPLVAGMGEFFWHFLPYMGLSYLTFNETARGYGRTWFSEQYNMVSFPAWIWATVSLVKKKARFIVTSKHLSSLPTYWRFLIPQVTIIILALVSVAVGLWRFTHGTSHFDTAALAANLFWTAYAVFFAQLAIRFAISRAGFRRQDYRFRLPLVAAVADENGQKRHAIVRDASASGLCLYFPVPMNTVNTQITGELLLPDGPLPFVADICAVTDEGRRLGVSFIWNEMELCHRLERFLYGTDHEWRIHNITDRSQTMCEYLLGLWRRCLNPLTRMPHAATHSMLYTTAIHPTAQPMPGMISIHSRGDRAQVMVFSPLPDNTAMETRIFMESGWKTLKARIANENSVDTGGSFFYHCELEEALA